MITEKDVSGNEYSYDVRLGEIESKPFRDQMNRRAICFCGFEKIHEEPIIGYVGHPEGYKLECRDGKFWLYIHCPKCGYDWSLWKLGVGRYD